MTYGLDFSHGSKKPDHRFIYYFQLPDLLNPTGYMALVKHARLDLMAIQVAAGTGIAVNINFPNMLSGFMLL
uniref:Uncharacterized protein n=1 Tax=mine drainage metagenome TaxID=410659 RepID=E6QTQ3_9ZZZZ